MKQLKLFVVLLFILPLMACTDLKTPNSNNWVVLPDLNGFEEAEVVKQLTDLNLRFTIEYTDDQVRELAGQFIMYKEASIGDIVNEEDAIVVIVYPPYTLSQIELPDISSMTVEACIAYFNEAALPHVIHYVSTTDEALDNQIIGYSDGYRGGDIYDTLSAIEVDVYVFEGISSHYFDVLDLTYDGPILDVTLINSEYMNPRGGAFYVTLLSCTDGDTAKFNYPTDIYQAITSSAKSTRFLNMDTEETYSGGEEEWGKPASVYTCGLLENAESIVIQTDPGDALLGNYGRLLGWIWIQLEENEDYQLLNYMVVQQGLAQVKYEFGAGETIMYESITYNEWMHIAEDQAIENSRGQWSNLIDRYWDYENDQPNYGLWN